MTASILFAAQASYGGPTGSRDSSRQCHKRSLAVILDVVYNHLGPEGNYLADFGPYFTDRYRTPWGDAVNFDGPYSDDVRNFFIENALHWFETLSHRCIAARRDPRHIRPERHAVFGGPVGGGGRFPEGIRPRGPSDRGERP